MFLEFCLVVGVTSLWWLRGILKGSNQPEVPKIYSKKDSDFVEDITRQAVILQLPYVSPFLWGRFGQLQTLAYGILGNRKSKRWLPIGRRVSLLCEDGATITYDVYEPFSKHWTSDDLTFLICPGIANSSRSVYIRSFVLYAQKCGYRCAVLNHLGVVEDIALTSARIFTYGGTAEFSSMADAVLAEYPNTSAIAVGFSMGGNVVSCYLAEAEKKQSRFLCGISVCQGYDILKSRSCLYEWQQLRRVYMFHMARNLRGIFARHRDMLFSEEIMKVYPSINTGEVFKATCLEKIDENYTRFVLGYETLDEMYRDLSSGHKLHKIEIPMLLVNAADDPIVPPPLLESAKQYAENHDKAMLVITRHGGHLGFLEGNSLLIPESVSWLSRLVVQYTDAVYTRSAVHDTWVAQDLEENSKHSVCLGSDPPNRNNQELKLDH